MLRRVAPWLAFIIITLMVIFGERQEPLTAEQAWQCETSGCEWGEQK